MDFSLPEELRLLRDTVRRFVDTELIPVERETCIGEELKPEWREKISARTKALGIWAMDVPAQYGGMELGVLARATVWAELGRTVALPLRGEGGVLGPSPRPILYALQGAQREKYLMPVLRGEKRTCLAQTEPDAGSDPGSMRTTARREGDVYIINGVKRFINHADKADFAQVMVATDRAKGSRGGISCILVDMDTPGVRVTTKYQTMMGDEPCEIVFENVRVPAENLVSGEGEGFGLAQKWLGLGRLKHAAHALGVTERCLALAMAYAKQRVTFGRPLADRQAIQFTLAEMAIELHAARLMVQHAAWKLDQDEDARQEAFMCKVHCDEMAFKAADRCMQIHGGIGLTTDLPIEKFWRRQRSCRITEGATEVMTMAIARSLLRS